MSEKAQREDELPKLEATYRRATLHVLSQTEQLAEYLIGEGYPEESARWVHIRIRTQLVANYETDTHQ